jgi:hypothetical protein
MVNLVVSGCSEWTLTWLKTSFLLFRSRHLAQPPETILTRLVRYRLFRLFLTGHGWIGQNHKVVEVVHAAKCDFATRDLARSRYFLFRKV